MVRHEVAAAQLAVLTLTDRRLLVYRHMVGASRHTNGVRLPKRKGIHRTARPRPARTAVAIAHALWIARNLELHGATEAFSAMRCHPILPASVLSSTPSRFSAAFRRVSQNLDYKPQLTDFK
jgi:hypothetical protein